MRPPKRYLILGKYDRMIAGKILGRPVKEGEYFMGVEVRFSKKIECRKMAEVHRRDEK